MLNVKILKVALATLMITTFGSVYVKAANMSANVANILKAKDDDDDDKLLKALANVFPKFEVFKTQVKADKFKSENSTEIKALEKKIKELGAIGDYVGLIKNENIIGLILKYIFNNHDGNDFINKIPDEDWLDTTKKIKEEKGKNGVIIPTYSEEELKESSENMDHKLIELTLQQQSKELKKSVSEAFKEKQIQDIFTGKINEENIKKQLDDLYSSNAKNKQKLQEEVKNLDDVLGVFQSTDFNIQYGIAQIYRLFNDSIKFLSQNPQYFDAIQKKCKKQFDVLNLVINDYYKQMAPDKFYDMLKDVADIEEIYVPHHEGFESMAILVKPKGKTVENLIVHVHGGPGGLISNPFPYINRKEIEESVKKLYNRFEFAAKALSEDRAQFSPDELFAASYEFSGGFDIPVFDGIDDNGQFYPIVYYLLKKGISVLAINHDDTNILRSTYDKKFVKTTNNNDKSLYVDLAHQINYMLNDKGFLSDNKHNDSLKNVKNFILWGDSEGSSMLYAALLKDDILSTNKKLSKVVLTGFGDASDPAESKVSVSGWIQNAIKKIPLEKIKIPIEIIHGLSDPYTPCTWTNDLCSAKGESFGSFDIFLRDNFFNNKNYTLLSLSANHSIHASWNENIFKGFAQFLVNAFTNPTKKASEYFTGNITLKIDNANLDFYTKCIEDCKKSTTNCTNFNCPSCNSIKSNIKTMLGGKCARLRNR